MTNPPQEHLSSAAQLEQAPSLEAAAVSWYGNILGIAETDPKAHPCLIGKFALASGTAIDGVPPNADFQCVTACSRSDGMPGYEYRSVPGQMTPEGGQFMGLFAQRSIGKWPQRALLITYPYKEALAVSYVLPQVPRTNDAVIIPGASPLVHAFRLPQGLEPAFHKGVAINPRLPGALLDYSPEGKLLEANGGPIRVGVVNELMVMRFAAGLPQDRDTGGINATVVSVLQQVEAGSPHYPVRPLTRPSWRAWSGHILDNHET